MGCDDDSDHRRPPSSSTDLLLHASSSSSTESSFREIEDAFLQNQTKIWLGEVLQIRLDEQLAISEVLADGELLFQVSKMVWRWLLAKHMDLRHITYQNQQPFAPKKNSGRYRPYSNVDSFLKICKILGLTGIDLFSPSDVVDKRNTRRVCMCIRSFSKKARAKNINVPDFDIVTYTITMPKDMVGCIRRNLEQSQSSLADSSSFYLQKQAGGKFRQGYSVTASTEDHETYLEESDDTEISHSELQSDRLGTNFLYDYTSEISSNVEETQVPSMVKSIFMSKDFDQLVVETPENELELLCSMASLRTCSENIEHDFEFNWSSSPSCGNSHCGLSAVTSHLDTRVKHDQERGVVDFNYSDLDLLGNNTSVTGNSENDRTPARRDASERVATSNLIDPVKDSLDSEETSTSNVHQSASSHGSNSTPGSIENGRRCFEIGENMEVIRNWSVEALDLGDQFGDQDNFQKHESFELQDQTKYRGAAYDVTSNARYLQSVEKFEENEYCNAFFHRSEDFLSFQGCLLSELCKWDQKGKCAVKPVISTNEPRSFSSSFPKLGSHEENTHYVRRNDCEVVSSAPKDEEETVVNLESDGEKLSNDCQAVSTKVVGLDYHDDADDRFSERRVDVITQDAGDRGKRLLGTLTDDVPSSYHNVVVSSNDDEDVSHTQSCLTNEFPKLECKDGNEACHSEHITEEHVPEEINPENEVLSVATKQTNIGRPRSKPQHMLLLKSVLGGTAAIGMLFMVLQLSRNGRQKGRGAKSITANSKDRVQKISSQNIQTRREGFYPAEKLKLGD